jgi:hypothetical protein
VADADQHRDRPAREDLPAPYVNPWGLLSSDLLAVLATVRLGFWRQWRRNREGELPRPAFWPQALAGWFWPLLLAAVLALLLAGGWGLQALGRSAPRSAAGMSAAVPAAFPPPALDPQPFEGQQLPAEPDVAEETATETPAEQAPPQEAVAAQPDPLLQAFAGEERAELLQAARVREPYGALELVLDQSGWQLLPSAERQRLAEQWQRRADDLGHGRLWLLDPQGRPLGRSARVGSGMILLAQPVPAHAP